MLEFQTPGFQGYSTKYSPFIDSRLAVVAAANFGLVGNGRLYVLRLTSTGIVAEKWFDTQDSLFDLAWSETHENQVVVASGDGSIKLFDADLDEFPIRSWHEHKREAFSVHWNLVAKDVFASSSWDGTIKVWSPEQAESSTMTLPTGSCTYSTAWSPHSPSVLSAVSSDSHLRIYDIRTPPSASSHLALAVPIHAPRYVASEALTHDWNKYREQVISTAGVDRLIRTFDLRMAGNGPYNVLDTGHDFAIRRIAWSPHLRDVMLSASYDMTARVWSIDVGEAFTPPESALAPEPAPRGGGAGRELGRMTAHTEFVTGLDWCLFGAEGWCATCAWDQRVLVWDIRSVMGPS